MSTTTATTETVEQRAIRAIAKGLGIKAKRIVPATRLAQNLGAKGLDIVELVMSLEEEFDFEISDAEAAKFQTVEDVVNFITQVEDELGR